MSGEAQIAIWGKQPPAAGYLIYDAELFAEAFDQSVPALRPWLETPTIVINKTLDSAITLRGATSSCDRCNPGDLLHLVFWWQVARPLRQDYKLFVHIADSTGRPLTQWDGLPGQNTQQTTKWPVGSAFEEHVLIRLPTDLPTGEYTVLVGLYDPNTGSRLGGEAIEVMQLSCD
ncbi:MAG: hypothetical protein R2932_26755 [Caldilineaceae bacterium]